MSAIELLLQELEQEAQTTRRVLERIPSDQLGWKPPEVSNPGRSGHARGRRPGRRGAARLRTVTGAGAGLFGPAEPAQHASELVPALERTVATVKATLGKMDDEALTSPWRLVLGDRELFTLPRAAFLRSVMLNHWYHHRGQLPVYLRELNVPVPSVYGPSADENPFA